MKQSYFSLTILIFSITIHGIGNTSAEKPNFILMLSDDQGWAGTSVQMHPDIAGSKNSVIKTPYLEKLAAQGMRFSQAYSPSSVCAPTRISLQTGQNPARLHWTKAGPSVSAKAGYKLIPPQNRRAIKTSEITIAEMLKTAGYATAHYGKWHIQGGGPENHGYDESDGNLGNEAAAKFKDPNPVDIFGMGQRAADFMKRQSQADKLFFIQLSYHALHAPENARQKTIDEYKKRLGNNTNRGLSRMALATDLDEGVGLLLEDIKKLGLEDNTYVIYMGDNGAGGGDGGGRGRRQSLLRGGKGSSWEGGIRVPFIIRGPGIKPNSFCHTPIVGFDLFTTFCKLAKVNKEIPKQVEGGDISHLFHGKTDPVKRPLEELVFHFPHYQKDTPHTALRLGDFKLMKFYETNELFLYDLSKSINEREDLSKKYPEKTTELHKRMAAYLKNVNAQLPTNNPNFDPNNIPDLPKAGPPPGRDRQTRDRTNRPPGRRGRNFNQ